ncbi:hypothetical protein LRAMOSA03967 [Lichtheimia ramosa]|uniref:Uncharacterized protein n=1 Tax=Lichtheimia ramosa TaxID=688394 RepID=A0A077WWW1_9FUNG|nr:hypothetical protein LRAMOSA03967 [Lichtheimia ramosa]
MGSRNKTSRTIGKNKPVFQGRVITKKKQKQHDRAIKNTQKWLASKGLVAAPEEEMSDLVVSSNPKLQRVVVEVPDHVLAAAAAGPGTTLGQPQ